MVDTYKGRKYASNRKAFLQVIDSVCADPHNVQKLADSMQEQLDNDPMKFMVDVVMPTIPRSMLEDSEGSSVSVGEEVRDALSEMDDTIEGPPVSESEDTITDSEDTTTTQSA